MGRPTTAFVLALGMIVLTACESGGASSTFDAGPDGVLDVPDDGSFEADLAVDVAPDLPSDLPAELPAGERRLAGRVYFFDLAPGPSLDQLDDVSGATVSLFGYPDRRIEIDEGGEFAFERLPDGVDLIIATEHPDFFPGLTKVFVLDGADVEDVAVQAVSRNLANLASMVVGVDPDAESTCSMATTVTAISSSMGSVWAAGEPGVTVTLDPPVPARYGPYYFNEMVAPDPSLEATTSDGGVAVAGPLAGEYTWYGHKEGYTFEPIRLRCVPGWLTNAGPPYGLVVSSEP